MLLPKGRIENPDIEKFERSVHDRISNGEVNIIIDFEEVEAIDPAGIRSLLSIAARILIKQGKLVLCGLGNNLGTLFRVAAIDQVVPIADSYQEAVANFREPRR